MAAQPGDVGVLVTAGAVARLSSSPVGSREFEYPLDVWDSRALDLTGYERPRLLHRLRHRIN